MAACVPIVNLVPLLPLRVVCRIWDTVQSDMTEFLAELTVLGLDLEGVYTAEDAVSTLYKKFSAEAETRGRVRALSLANDPAAQLLTKFEVILKRHLTKG